MNLRPLFAAASLVASMAFPAVAGAQVTFHAGVRVGTPPPPVVVVQQPPPQQVVVVAQPQPQQVVVVQRPAPQPVYVAAPAPQPVYVAGPGRFRGRRGPVVVQTPGGVYVERGRGRRGHRH